MAESLTGKRCRFRLRDVICPDRQQILSQITPEMEISGEVAFLSDHGQDQNYFAIVTVAGLASPLIVPVARLETADDPVREVASKDPAAGARYERASLES
jgi:hypothetical protein